MTAERTALASILIGPHAQHGVRAFRVYASSSIRFGSDFP
jgi:hypothetical protein